MTTGLQLITNIRVATMRNSDTPYGLMDDAALVIEQGQLVWVGHQQNLPYQYHALAAQNYENRLVTPALIDCHTHIIAGGNRAVEFEMRLNGASYKDIAKAGGGILSTVAATRAASVDELVDQALPRIDTLVAEGVSVIEIKSGYGLDKDTEIRMLRAARRIEKIRSVKIVTSFLGAHAIAPEYAGNANAYLDQVCLPALRAAHAEGLVDMVDGFCESIAFNPKQIARVFDLAAELDIPVKLHAEQLSNSGGSKLAAAYGARSVDHIEYADEEDVAAMSKANSIAVVLPGAFYTLRETQLPPIELLRKYKVPMAVSTDSNPGSSPLTSLLLCMNMACTLFRLTPEETLAGVTKNAAAALGLSDRGVIEAGMRADLAIWDIQHPAELCYRIGFNPLYKRITGDTL